MLNIFDQLKEAYEVSTLNTNHFERVLNLIKWDNKFFTDGEHYFIKGDMTFTTPSLNPFEISKDWKPSAFFADGSYMEF